MGRMKDYHEVILWVDDDPLILDYGGEALEVLGYKPITVKSGQEAIEIYARFQEGISSVILDMVMPHMNGDEVYEKLANINPNIKVLIVTGLSDWDNAEKMLANSSTEILKKPFTFNALSRKIDNLLRANNKNRPFHKPVSQSFRC